jgi:hypothetical protein
VLSSPRCSATSSPRWSSRSASAGAFACKSKSGTRADDASIDTAADVERHMMVVASKEAFKKAISVLASFNNPSVSASFSSSKATRSRCRARWRRWFSRTRLRVCSAETRGLRGCGCGCGEEADDVGEDDISIYTMKS